MNKKPIPAQGISLREAATSEFSAVVNLVRRAIVEKLYPGRPNAYADIESVFADRVIINKDGRMFSYPYTINASNQVEMGEGQEVIEAFVPVRESAPVQPGVFVEAVGEADSGKWLIRVMRSGLSTNRNFYPDAVLRESAPLFEGARVFIKSDIEHVKGGGKDVRNLVGGLTQAKFIEGATADTGQLQAVLTMIEPDGDVAVKLREASARGMAGLFGFSIDADGKAKTEMREGRKVRVATSISKVSSVDLIVEPAAGGELIRMVESINPLEDTEMTLRQTMLDEIKAKSPTAHAKLGDASSDAEITAAYREAVAPAPAGGSGDAEERIRMIEARMVARDLIGASKLPTPAKERLLADFSARERFVEADVTTAIAAEREYLAKFTESGKPVIHFGDGVQVEDRSVKMDGMLDAFFDAKHKDHRSALSFRECYREITGDYNVTGRTENCDRVRMREAAGERFVEADSSTFSYVLGSAMNRRMQAEYAIQSNYDVWKQLVTVQPIFDFRTQHLTSLGGYGDIPVVGERQPYLAMATPGDEETTYGIVKRGGTEDVTFEMVRNDDVRLISRIPLKMAQAAKRTLSKTVLNNLRDNPVIYDTKALFHADHGNLGTAALDAISYAAARLAMMKQTEPGSLEPMGVGPANLWVPFDLEEAAHNIFARSTNLDKTFIQSLVPNIISVWYWTDTTDWCATADANQIPTIEVGFLDGREEPELFVMDIPTAGSVFTNDVITYKMRHIYGAAVENYRGMRKNVVA